jgi:Ankyrin repeats (many copies)
MREPLHQIGDVIGGAAGKLQTQLTAQNRLIAAVLAIGIAVCIGNSFSWKILGALGLTPDRICSNMTVLQDYLKQGGDPNARIYYIRTFSANGSRRYPLLFCVSKEGVSLLLKHGANPNIEESGEPILFRAVIEDDLKLLEKLLKSGANPNSKVTIPQPKDPLYNFPILHRTVENGQEEMTEMLINNGADINAKSSDGETALDVAARRRQEIIGRMLIEKGAYRSDERTRKYR